MLPFQQQQPMISQQQILALQQLENQQQMLNATSASLLGQQPPQQQLGMMMPQQAPQNIPLPILNTGLLSQPPVHPPIMNPSLGVSEPGGMLGKRGMNEGMPDDSMMKRRRIERKPVEWKWDESVEINLMVPNECLGILIGKAAIGLREINRASDAQILIQDSEMCSNVAKERCISLRGSFESVKTAELKILEKLHQRNAQMEDGAEGNETVKWVIPGDLTGMLIGRAGNTLKTIKAQSGGAYIRIANEQELGPGATERVVYISGSEDKVEKAVHLVKEKVGGHAFGDPGLADGMESQDVMVPTRSVGFILGAGGRDMKKICEQSGARVRIASAAELATGSTDHKVTVSGTKEAIKKARQLLRERVELWKSEQPSVDEGDIMQKHTLVKMTLPRTVLGHLIGKGGSGVREICTTSSAQVKVLQDVPPSSLDRLDQPVVFSGKLQNILKAQEMVLERVCAAPSNLLEAVKAATNPEPGKINPQAKALIEQASAAPTNLQRNDLGAQMPQRQQMQMQMGNQQQQPQQPQQGLQMLQGHNIQPGLQMNQQPGPSGVQLGQSQLGGLGQSMQQQPQQNTQQPQSQLQNQTIQNLLSTLQTQSGQDQTSLTKSLLQILQQSQNQNQGQSQNSTGMNQFQSPAQPQQPQQQQLGMLGSQQSLQAPTQSSFSTVPQQTASNDPTKRLQELQAQYQQLQAYSQTNLSQPQGIQQQQPDQQMMQQMQQQATKPQAQYGVTASRQSLGQTTQQTQALPQMGQQAQGYGQGLQTQQQQTQGYGMQTMPQQQSSAASSNLYGVNYSGIGFLGGKRPDV